MTGKWRAMGKVGGAKRVGNGGMAEREAGAGRIGASRLEAFSDGVLAIIITIMVLELRPPDQPSFHALRGMLPVFLAYALSFVMVGIYWNNHHHLLRATESISGSVMWANMHLLFWLSLVPFATAWVGRQHSHSWPAALYGMVAFLAAIAYSILVIAIERANPGSAVVEAIGRDRKGNASLSLYAIGLLLAFVTPWLGYAAYLIVACIWFIPDRRLSKLPE